MGREGLAMAITLEGIQNVNKRIQKIKIKGKDYATVAARVQAFRELCPDGLIHAEIISINDGVVLMQAQVKDENGKLLATGYAQEKENASMINKTSYIENCETSAVGRALAMLGLGSEENIASSQEVYAAQAQQAQMENSAPQAEDHANEMCNEIDLASLEALTKKAFPGKSMEQVYNSWPNITKAQYAAAIDVIRKLQEARSGNKGKDNANNASVS